ncbi:MAG: hypothetical protein A2504_12365 [Bdellovibrionales bacterium RIFOXYD12_FULL_39_22]|nr:MAG: hypothetical protein A2385_17900 [Bdellovibrionales bacterium RIFOXYB1_FULL_39_21]OFZ40701.1 MAG: hypothetical protein A2485_03675 [Bdellovibrionales bacterium RIFOXYC12_FULL_39_17]OFZ49742.1 MAG: hypothetical protein A2404_00030 [Bdellovibrionales bacterium RIFOXYC1_FULL_39_130]OFZ71340.1 MAG: hypothetical protein A2451_08670 [Bdellovibrionales bacterium RIFOXYC2_FULL_39_8]OFZ77282.1 MAG: hypothetical protein A2560_14890 [Bdellovibrionales bacterium RIFOXYD1_FULL_39_84]OFZ91823.1 MAG:
MLLGKKGKLLLTIKVIFLLDLFLLIGCLPKAVINSPAVEATPIVDSTPKATSTIALLPIVAQTTVPIESSGVVLVNENFNDRSYAAPLSYYTGTAYDYPINYQQNESDYSLQFDHSNSGSSGIGTISNLENYLEDGIYFRYWVNYPESYYFPGDMGTFDNLKMLKIAGTSGDIEFIYKDSAGGGPKSLQLYWNNSIGDLGGTRTGTVPLGQTLTKGVWHKIEIYIKIAAPSVVHVQIDDYNVYQNTNADINLPASGYTGTQQFMSVRAGNSGTPEAGHGIWYHDNVTIISGGGDLCDEEPPALKAATLITQDDFENGALWQYLEHWDIYDSYLFDEWDIVSDNPHSGQYCAQSKSPGPDVWTDDSVFTHSLPLDKNEIFIRFWFKASPNLSAWWAQFMRFFGDGGDLEIGMGVDGGGGDILINTGESTVFGTTQPIHTGWGDFLSSTSWTEYAVYINYSENELYFWKNAAHYNLTDPSFHSIPVNWQHKYSRFISPIYYKREITDGGSSLFWVDDFEIWDGIPAQ